MSNRPVRHRRRLPLPSHRLCARCAHPAVHARGTAPVSYAGPLARARPRIHLGHMILVTGNDPAVEDVCAALDRVGRAHRRVDALDAEQAWQAGATAVVLVESVPRLDAAARRADRGLREIISAANAPGVRTAIIVTPRADADPELRAVRRSGIPYAILRPHPLVERSTEPVLVPRDLASAPAGAITVDMLADAVIGALDGQACGQTLDVAPPSGTTWADLLARAGAAPRAVPAWRARVGRWFGARTFAARPGGAGTPATAPA